MNHKMRTIFLESKPAFKQNILTCSKKSSRSYQTDNPELHMLQHSLWLHQMLYR
jgi:hypothetical protein